MLAPGRTLLALALTALGARQGASRVWQSDLSVNTVDLTALRRGGSLSARIAVGAAGDAARAVRLEILLPIGVAVLRLGPGCHASPSPVESLNARVSCLLGDLPHGATRAVVIVTTPAPPASRRRLAVFAFSDTPDPAPSNNFAERVIP
jgi:hypothetical protein